MSPKKPLPANLVNPFLEPLRDTMRARGLKPEHSRLLQAVEALNEAVEAVDVRAFARVLSQEESEIIERGFYYLSKIKTGMEG